jgi:hypothetical protein
MYSHRFTYTLVVAVAKLFEIGSIVDTGQSRFSLYFRGVWYSQYQVPVNYKDRK